LALWDGRTHARSDGEEDEAGEHGRARENDVGEELGEHWCRAAEAAQDVEIDDAAQLVFVLKGLAAFLQQDKEQWCAVLHAHDPAFTLHAPVKQYMQMGWAYTNVADARLLSTHMSVLSVHSLHNSMAA